jgi:[acyl-carrier-protein] S-malonyltransferase
MGCGVHEVVFGESGETIVGFMKTAYIFPGQGSQYVGMGKDLYERYAEVRMLYARADEILGFRLSRLCFEGPEEELRQTMNTQPAIFLHSIAVARLLPAGMASMAAGHSLGEYTALVVAGALTFEDGLKLVRLRGELMQEAGLREPGTMAAIVGLESETVNQICAEANTWGVVQAANFNSPGQIVISGSVASVRKAMELASQRGAKLVKELQVSGAFHSPLMAPARDGLKVALDRTPIQDATIPVYANTTAQPVRKANEICTLLAQQLTSPVRWEETIRNMIRDGATVFIELGPGKVLQGLVKRINGTVTVRGVDKSNDLSTLV